MPTKKPLVIYIPMEWVEAGHGQDLIDRGHNVRGYEFPLDADLILAPAASHWEPTFFMAPTLCEALIKRAQSKKTWESKPSKKPKVATKTTKSIPLAGLARLREKAGLSQKELSLLAEVGARTIVRIETDDKYAPNKSVASALANALNVQVKDLYGKEG